MSSDLDVIWSYVGFVPSSGKNDGRIKIPIPPRGAPHPSSFRNSEGIETKCELNPPDLEVVQNALSSLIENAKLVNQDYLSNTNNDPAFDRDAKGRLSELIKVACQALIREADIKSCDQRLQHDVEAAEYRRQRDSQLADTRYTQNASLPIHQFPVELFSKILTFVVHTTNINYYDVEPTLRRLASVARHWKDVILSTPQLWSNLHEAMSATFVHLSLNRSKTVPLDVCFYRESYNYSAPQLGPFSQTILPLSDRWRSVEGPYLAPQILEKLASQVPILQVLRLVRTSTEGVQLGEGLHLQTLNLTEVCVPWDSSRISQLCTLSLTDIRGQHAPTLSQIARILASSPNLESLALVRLEPLDTLKDDQSFVRNISLPNLRSLEIFELSWDSYNRLMKCFQFPFVALKELRLEPEGPADQDVSDTFDYLANGFVQQVNSFADDANASIWFGGRTVTLEVGCPSKGKFSLRTIVKEGVGQKGVDAYSDAVTALAELISAALPDAPLALHTSSDTHPGFSVDNFMRFPSTVELVLQRGGGCDIRSVVQFLGQQHASDSGEGSDLEWPCPKLKKLDIGELLGHPVGNIRAWVKQRWVKWKEPTDDPSTTADQPDGLLEVMIPFKKSRKTEMWCPVQRAQNIKRVVLRRKARVVYDNGEEDQGDD
ncbi:hypothetical protein FRB94_014083 [Tulasnella sp. JGI-2019a]|nr:hypothetical protein FRB94_014083 [Tulasnella sp. JGI-2019a]KAG9028339.1 hypothetical protein FRB95_006566 [Tulasnella sp. JGI-2019a]